MPRPAGIERPEAPHRVPFLVDPHRRPLRPRRALRRAVLRVRRIVSRRLGTAAEAIAPWEWNPFTDKEDEIRPLSRITSRDRTIAHSLIDAGYGAGAGAVFDFGTEAAIEHACRWRLKAKPSERAEVDLLLWFLTESPEDIRRRRRTEADQGVVEGPGAGDE